MWKLSVEGESPCVVISRQQLKKTLERLSVAGRRTFAILRCEECNVYYQCAGDGKGMLLEKRNAGGHQLRAFQEPPLKSRRDGEILEFSVGSVPLRRDEWFRRAQVVEVMWSVIQYGIEPDLVRWRDISGLLE
jgi:hypothetical protein